ncbi:cytochrome o ubiquinol oxidase subunit IV [Amaricoccus tamworthensis]|uniref:cytochrome o ubiquinol oxidase subunit IV n=1 Tax=Amaricoccus tamworthensis TaxID=57002 RepID=UPI003C7D89D2
MSSESHGSYRSYIIGFVLSVILTAIPFWVVMSGVDISLAWAIAIIFGLGAIQIMVHVHYFLHVTVKAEQGWQVMSMVFTAVLLVIVLAGSIWVMTHLDENMMPAHEQIERVRNLP